MEMEAFHAFRMTIIFVLVICIGLMLFQVWWGMTKDRRAQREWERRLEERRKQYVAKKVHR